MEEKKKKSFFKNIGIYLSLTALGAATAAAALEFKKIYMKEEKTPLEESLKKEILEEYKTIFLKDKNLRLVFTEEELSRKINEQVLEINIGKTGAGYASAQYNMSSKEITLDKDKYSKEALVDNLWHELTHAVFARDAMSNGFLVISSKDDKSLVYKHGEMLNEGATTYISRKLMEDTNYKVHNSLYTGYIEVIRMLSITYGEEFIFKAMKQGPEVLAKQLEKDGVSYNELVTIMDEVQKARLEFIKNDTIENKNKCEDLLKRLLKIPENLLLKKFDKATPKEKMEIVKRAREISAEQSLYRRTGNKPSDLIVEKMNNDVYSEYLSKIYKNYEKNKGGFENLSEVESRISIRVIQNIILNRYDINVEDMNKVKFEVAKTTNGQHLTYIAKLDDKILSVMNMDTVINMLNDRDSVSLLVYLNAVGEKKEFTDIQKKYKLLSESIVSASRLDTFFDTITMSTDKGTKVFMKSGKNNTFEELTVEEGFSLGQVLEGIELVQKPNILQKVAGKIKNVGNRKNTKMLPAGNQKPEGAQVDFLKNNENENWSEQYKVVTEQQLKQSTQKRNMESENER